jgi:hypothetical protein
MATAHRLIDQGLIADRPMFFANIPSVLDETMRVGDSHVLSLETLYTPYALKGGWEQSSEPERWLQRFATLVEGTFFDTVERWRAMTPLIYEREFNLPRGHATGFSGSPLSATARPASRAHALRDPGQRALPHRRGDLSGRRCVGRKRAKHCDRDLAGLIRPLGDRLLGAPGELDPLVGLTPDVLALHDRSRLLVEDRAAHLAVLADAEVLDEGQRVAGISDVVGDEHARLGEVDARVGEQTVGT